MKQAFNFGSLAQSLGDLLSGNNQVRGQMDAARAMEAQAKAEAAARQNMLLNPQDMDYNAAKYAGLDDEQARQYADFKGKRGQFDQAVVDETNKYKGIQPLNMSFTPQSFVNNSRARIGVRTGMADMPKVDNAAAIDTILKFMTPDKQQAIDRARQNIFAGAAMGGNMRNMVQNTLDTELQDRNTEIATQVQSKQLSPDIAAIVGALSNGKTPPQVYSANSNGAVINRLTGAFDTSNPLAQSNIGKINAQTGLIGQQTIGEQADTEKTIQDMNLNDQEFALKYAKYLSDANPKLFNKTIVDEQGKTYVIEDTNAVKEAAIYASQNGISINQARQIILSGNANTTQNQGNNPFIAPISHSFMPQKSEIKHPADLARAVQSGQMTPEQADQYAHKMGW